MPLHRALVLLCDRCYCCAIERELLIDTAAAAAEGGEKITFPGHQVYPHALWRLPKTSRSFRTTCMPLPVVPGEPLPCSPRKKRRGGEGNLRPRTSLHRDRRTASGAASTVTAAMNQTCTVNSENQNRYQVGFRGMLRGYGTRVGLGEVNQRIAAEDPQQPSEARGIHRRHRRETRRQLSLSEAKGDRIKRRHGPRQASREPGVAGAI